MSAIIFALCALVWLWHCFAAIHGQGMPLWLQAVAYGWIALKFVESAIRSAIED